MNDYIVRLREKYDDHFGCVSGIILDYRDFWRHCVTAPEMAALGYHPKSSRRPHHVVITAGVSQARTHLAPYMGSARWSSELICYLDVLGDEDLRHLRWLAGLPLYERLILGHGHSVAFGFPLYKYSLLRHFLLLPTPLDEDAAPFDSFDLSAHPIDLLWIVPLTEQEYQVRVNKHLESTAEVLNDARYPLSLDRHRHCYVTDQRLEGFEWISYQVAGQSEQEAYRQTLPPSGKPAMASFNRFDAVFPVCRSARRLRFLLDVRTAPGGRARKL